MKLVLLAFASAILLLAPAAATAQVPAQPPAPSTSGMADFGLVAVPGTVSVHRGATAQIKVTLAPVSGFRGKVQLIASLLYGTTATFQPPSVDNDAATTTLTIAPGPSALRGSYVMSITGVSPGVSHTITIRVRIR